MGALKPSSGQGEEEVNGTIHFLARLPVYNSVKPFTLRYDPGSGFPATNIENEGHDIKIQNMRSQNLSYEKCGFQFCSISSAMRYEDYSDEDLVRSIHFPEVKACLKDTLGASFVEIVDLAQRKRHVSFPVATGVSYDTMQPTSRAHIDVTLESARDTARQTLGARADEILARRWQMVNIWHPRRGPLYDWPLAVCDASSVDFDADTMPGDSVDVEGSSETTQVQFNEKQRWYYLAGQQHSDLLIFKNADSLAEKGVPLGTPHAAFDLPRKLHSKSGFLRESIEMRAFVAW